MAANALPLDPETCAEMVQSDYWPNRVAVDSDTGCHVWTGYVNAFGYGMTECRQFPGLKKRLAHRVALTAALGRPMSPQMESGHKCHDSAYLLGECAGGVTCRHRRCVNPEHLQEEDARTNVLAAGAVAAINARKTHCPRGHELTPLPENRKQCGTKRHCPECARQNSRESSAVVWAAARVLGLEGREYIARFGQSRARAEAIISACAAAGIDVPPPPTTRTHCARGHALALAGGACSTCITERSKRSTDTIRAAAHALGIGVMEYRKTFGQSLRVAERAIAYAEGRLTA